MKSTDVGVKIEMPKRLDKYLEITASSRGITKKKLVLELLVEGTRGLGKKEILDWLSSAQAIIDGHGPCSFAIDSKDYIDEHPYIPEKKAQSPTTGKWRMPDVEFNKLMESI